MNKYLVNSYKTYDQHDVEKYAIVEAESEEEAEALFNDNYSYLGVTAQYTTLLEFTDTKGTVFTND